MSNTSDVDLGASLPRPSILVDPCMLLDEMGLWATARLSGSSVREVDLYLPARRTVRRLEIGHGEDALGQLGRGSRQRLLGAVDKALTHPLKLVIDPRRSDGGTTILDEEETPRRADVHELAATLGANSFTVADYAVEMSIRAPTHKRLARGAASVFGSHAALLFRHVAHAVPPTVGEIIETAFPRKSKPLIRGASLKVARYIRTATTNARGNNSLEAQHARINRYLTEIGAKSTYVVVDEGCNGMASGRSGLNEVLRLAARGQIDAVVATSADRFFRSATQFDRLIVQLRGEGVSVMLADHTLMLGADRILRRGRKP